ncbi:MAG: dienelactone hydrolase family protein [Acidiferrobacterales bacterium]
MPCFTRTIDVGGVGMAVYEALPEGTQRCAAIVVIQHAPGVDSFLHRMADRLAEAGYAAVAPDLYHRLDPTHEAMERFRMLKDREVETDVNAVVDYLQLHARVDGRHLGVAGFCMGGRVTYLMAAANPHFKAAVAYYGGNIMVPWGDDVVAPFARSPEIRCPLMFHAGAEDTNPSPQDLQMFDAELSRLGKPHEFFSYAGAGHAFMNFTSAERYRESADRTSWLRTLDFFARYLRS